ncbi:hypothetical protein BDY24DRAFT_154834 [Mrakia frigida]|uniref:AN1-type zinc finger protein n=1 Tax=Mrakia frigida TaxID=29902 RepID=UPI003FCC0C6E
MSWKRLEARAQPLSASIPSFHLNAHSALPSFLYKRFESATLPFPTTSSTFHICTLNQQQQQHQPPPSPARPRPSSHPPSLSMSSDELLFIHNQVECSHPSCHLHDFLPIKCPGCKLPFCTLHHSPFHSATTHSHPCTSPPPDRTPIPCPLCSLPIGTPVGEDPNDTMDRHLGSKKCIEKKDEVGREREVLRAKKERGDVCFAKGCKKGLVGGLGVKCSSCIHTFCTNHRFPSSHSCSTINLLNGTPTPSSRTPTPTPLPKGIRQVLGGPSREAALAAIKRQAPTSKPKEPQPMKPKEKDVNPNEKGKGGGTKPLQNPLSATSRHSKSELASRKKALAQRAKLGLLSEEEKVAWAECVGKEESGRRKKEGASGKKKDGCVVC